MKPRRKTGALLALLLALLLLLSGCAEVLETVTEALPEATEAFAVTTQAPAEEPAEKAAKATRKPKATKTPKAAKTAKPTKTPKPAAEDTGPIIESQAIADYLFEHGELPDNFITKKEAQALGWQSGYRYVSDAAPGMSIGGDYFGNYEGQLPKAKGRKYYECDCYYVDGPRNAYRIIFSNDGLVFYTEDHYQTFVQMFPSVPEQPAAP
jgi:hypothetical protein